MTIPTPSGDPDSNWLNNDIQFARLIAEAEAAGLWDVGESAFQEMCESMDLEPAQIFELVERAQAIWDEIKQRI